MRQPLNARRVELRLPCDKTEPPRVVLEKMPARSSGLGLWIRRLAIALFGFALAFAAVWLLRHR